MPSPRPFLTARWSNLCIVSYQVPRELLTPLLPKGLELDARNGMCFASLVAFDFLDTRVLGIRWPRMVNFPEVNLRFYVREGDRRGVCFVRELVPRSIIAWVARAMYNEPYRTARMTSRVEERDGNIVVSHSFSRAGARGRLEVRAEGKQVEPPSDSEAHFFKEHEWGYGTSRRGNLLRYRVHHPVWVTYRVKSCHVDIDWADLYGRDWGFLQGREPASVILAAGSTVEVFPLTREPQALGNP